MHATTPDFFVEMGVSLTFFLGWPQIAILLISVSQLAGITGMSHYSILE
jgi:hypothetical protein